MCRQGPLGGHAHSGIAIIAVLPLHLRLGLKGQKIQVYCCKLSGGKKKQKKTDLQFQSLAPQLIKRQATTHPASATANALKVL